MVSDDESGILGSIPGAWVSDDSESQLDLDLSLPHFTKPCSPPASFLLNSPAGRPAVPHPATLGSYPPRSPTKSMPSKSSMSNLDRVVRFHRRLSNSLFSSQDVTPRPPTGRGKTSKVTKKQMESTPQTLPSLLDDSSATTTPSPSPIAKDLPPILPPLCFPPSSLPDDTLSLSSRVTRLSFGPSLLSFSSDSPFDSVSSSGSVLDPGWDFSSPVYRHAQLSRSRTSSSSSVIDRFPSSASLQPIPSIPSISSGFQLNNLPTPSPSTLIIEPQTYSYFTAGDVPVSSFFETLPVISPSPSSNSLVESFVPTAQQAHQDMLMARNPLSSNMRARIVVKDELQVDRGYDTRQHFGSEPWAYTCQTLPYEAGMRPHVYVDNSGSSLRGKRSTCARHSHQGMAGDTVAKSSPKENKKDRKEKIKTSPTSKLKKLVRGSSISRFLDFHATRKKTGAEKENIPPVPVSSSPVNRHFSLMGLARNVSPASPHSGSDDGTATTIMSPPTTPKPGARSSKRFSLPRPLSLFVVPKPRVRVVESSATSTCPDYIRSLDESFEVLSPPRLNADSGVEIVDAKSTRRRSWFNLASPTVGPASRRFSR